MFKLVQIFSNLFKIIQTCSNLCKQNHASRGLDLTSCQSCLLHVLKFISDLTPNNDSTLIFAMFSKKTLLNNPVRKSEEVKKSAGKVVDPKRDTPTRAKVSFIQGLLIVVYIKDCPDGSQNDGEFNFRDFESQY